MPLQGVSESVLIVLYLQFFKSFFTILDLKIGNGTDFPDLRFVFSNMFSFFRTFQLFSLIFSLIFSIVFVNLSVNSFVNLGGGDGELNSVCYWLIITSSRTCSPPFYPLSFLSHYQITSSPSNHYGIAHFLINYYEFFWGYSSLFLHLYKSLFDIFLLIVRTKSFQEMQFTIPNLLHTISTFPFRQYPSGQ